MKHKFTAEVKKIFIVASSFVFLYGNAQNHTIDQDEKNDVNKNNPEPRISFCGNEEYEKYLEEKYNYKPSVKKFEEWLAPKVLNTKLKLKSARYKDEVKIIPVIVHVVAPEHEKIGEGGNLSDERINSQIEVLNQDFRRMPGSRGFNTNPIGVDTGIEFRLAKIDPNGNPTNGINRIPLVGKYLNKQQIEETIKPQTQWDPEKYMNIWVIYIIPQYVSAPIGYSSFPHASGLDGLEDLKGIEFIANRDGVVINPEAFGSSDTVEGNYRERLDKGRTLTHETGHFLGLRHIWGDNESCELDEKDSHNDYCLDTPAASHANWECDQIVDSCPLAPGNDMTENYMDYSYDACTNTFTEDQKARMLTVLANSPRRASLLTSKVWLDVNDTEVKDTSGDILIYPNPAKDKFEVVISQENETVKTYEIFTGLGQLIKKEEVNASTRFTVNTSSFSPGLYFIKLSTNKKTKKIKFIIVK
ncbi:M43 family zinc metalloprotease [Apibacter raozihei]|uniref:M43 family zinc metalloprotease n=1 Tax=Apibacter raozihei TaxID=2500547 RepID=UPI000FE3AAAC|nr:M43 family zinc metalloprotease [Apibacter raozihei]